MSYKSILRNSAIIIMASVLTLTACRRDKDDANNVLTNADDNGGYATDAAKLDRDGNDIISIADAAVETGGTNLRTTATTLGGCATITRDTTGTVRTVVIDFGTGTCTSLDGRVRRGRIIVSYTGNYKDAGSVHTITTDNYYVDGYKVIVHKSVTNRGMNSSGQYWYDVTVKDTIIISSDSFICWTGNRTRTWLAGYSTPTRSDDEYLIGGTTTLRRASGREFTHTISATDPLKVALACRWIMAGTVTITSSSFTGGSRTINYTYAPSGMTPGGCDDKAQLTIGSRTHVITMR
ncbi:MAG: hypothetical protein K0Q79_426 [Flavipsychrobacter sp.]|jgi:hypothetical protein|nr:hypothetical protein [Flavipsychrobacter sp.]